MMYEELYQYLIQYKELSVPGIGTFLLERRPATIDFPNKQMNPPAHVFLFLSTTAPASGKFFNRLGALFNISQSEAVIRFNDFAFDLKKMIKAGDTIYWSGVGTLRQGFGGEIKFTAQHERISLELPVPAAKVLREKAEHTVRVGEEEKTSSEMTELLSHSKEKKSYWWTWAVVAGLLSVLFIGWYFSEHGLEPASSANGQKARLNEAASTYRQLP